ncbi:IS66 family transposase [Bradyrhizobium sp. USDA 4506]
MSCTTIAATAALIHQSWYTHYAPGRSGKHAEHILDGFDSILQVDGYPRLSQARTTRASRRRAAAAGRMLVPHRARGHCRDSEGPLTHRRSRPRAHRHALCN